MMDAGISLALASKLRKIFENEERFLTFPIGLGYTYKSLAFMDESAGLTPQEQLNFKGNFARQFNLVPDDSVQYLPDPGRLLWNDVREIIHTAQFAASALSPEEEKKLDEAKKYLQTEISSNGESTVGYSRALAEYYQYRKIYNEAKEAYLNEKLSVEFASGPGSEELITAWQTGREAELKAMVGKAEQDWLMLGHRLEVEEKQIIIKNLEPRKYLETYRQDYLSDIDVCELADLNGEGVGFYTTFFSPNDAFKKSLPWPTISLTKEELKKLVNEASPDLKAMLGGDNNWEGIESIYLEYNNVVIMRPWFRPDFFYARHWNLPTGDLVSNGKIPCSGKIPAYVTSMLVARNMTIIKKKTADVKANHLAILNRVPLQKLKFDKPTVRVGTRLFPMPEFLPKPVRPRETRRLNLNPALMRRVPVVGSPALAVRGTKPKPILLRARFDGTTVTTLKPSMEHLRMNALYRKKGEPSLVTETYDFDGVSVLALVCKRIPKCPDPDPTLAW